MTHLAKFVWNCSFLKLFDILTLSKRTDSLPFVLYRELNTFSWLTFFLSSTEMALASFRKMALPQRSSRNEVNWWYFHLRQAMLASSNSRSVQLHSMSNRGFTEKAFLISDKSSTVAGACSHLCTFIKSKIKSMLWKINICMKKYKKDDYVNFCK